MPNLKLYMVIRSVPCAHFYYLLSHVMFGLKKPLFAIKIKIPQTHMLTTKDFETPNKMTRQTKVAILEITFRGK